MNGFCFSSLQCKFPSKSLFCPIPLTVVAGFLAFGHIFQYQWIAGIFVYLPLFHSPFTWISNLCLLSILCALHISLLEVCIPTLLFGSRYRECDSLLFASFLVLDKLYVWCILMSSIRLSSSSLCCKKHCFCSPQEHLFLS